MKPLIVIAALMAIAACDTSTEAANNLARTQAKWVVNGVVESKFPGASAIPVTDCIIDAASAREIRSIARASVTGTTDKTANLVVKIAQRPQAVTCIAENSLTLLDG